MSESVEVLERRIQRLRAAVREAVLAGDRERARGLRVELRAAERDWDDALAQVEAAQEKEEAGPRIDVAKHAESAPVQPLLPLREQVHEALSLLTVPAAPQLIATVHEAFFASTFATSRLTSLKRDEERSFRAAPFARPYYICAALTADLLAPVRGLLAVSTWPVEQRVIGSLSPRVDFLIAAIRVAEAIERLIVPVPAAQRLLWRFAASIPAAVGPAATMDPQQVAEAAAAELTVHEQADRETRKAAAQRARDQLDDVQQLFGARLQPLSSQPGRTK